MKICLFLLSLTLLLSSQVKASQFCIFDDDGVTPICTNTSENQLASDRAYFQRLMLEAKESYRDKVVDGIPYMGFGSLDNFLTALRRIRYQLEYGEDEVNVCEGIEANCEDFADFPIISIMSNTARHWCLSTFAQRCFDILNSEISILDSITNDQNRINQIREREKRYKEGKGSGGSGGSGSGGGGANSGTGSNISPGNKDKNDKKDKDDLPENMT